MSEQRLRRRIAGFLRKRLTELHLDDVPDARDPRGRRWKLATLLGAAIVGLAAGANSLGEVEDITEQMTPETRRWLHIPRRVPDTTLRDTLLTLQPEKLSALLHHAVRAAHRRKALPPDVLPIGMVTLDGKVSAVPACNPELADLQPSRAS